MTPQTLRPNQKFRSKQEREREAALVGNYRAIGIAAIAAAAANLSISPKRKTPFLATRVAAVNGNGRG